MTKTITLCMVCGLVESDDGNWVKVDPCHKRAWLLEGHKFSHGTCTHCAEIYEYLWEKGENNEQY